MDLHTTPSTGYSFSGWEVVLGTGVSFENASAASTLVILTSEHASFRADFTP